MLVCIYGGGYTGGSKSGSGNPAGLIASAQDNGEGGVVYVQLNYRLGLFVSLYPHTMETTIANSTRAGSLGLPSKLMVLQMQVCMTKNLL